LNQLEASATLELRYGQPNHTALELKLNEWHSMSGGGWNDRIQLDHLD